MSLHKMFGLIGFPLGHSFSKKYFTEKFEKAGLNDHSYELYPLENIDDLPALLKAEPLLAGLNVTIPHKETVLKYLDTIDPVAAEIGAVNCISIKRSNDKISLSGFNTDAGGFRKSIRPFLESGHERALILGTGGAAKAVKYVLQEIGIDCFFVSRKKNDAEDLHTLSYSELNEHVMKAFRLIVNCSPLGTYPAVNERPDIPYEFLTDKHLLYDLVYNPAETAFLKEGKARGAQVVNGLSMLHLQAEEAWLIWNKL